jgi:hypothetical protein
MTPEEVLDGISDRRKNWLDFYRIPIGSKNSY